MPLGRNTKGYETPNHPFQGERINQEHSLVSQYGLESKEELWQARSQLRSFRREARRLLGHTAGESGEEFLARLKRIGILNESADLQDVLSLDETDILERRLQTVVYRKGLANTTSQARQFVTHGHITINGQRVTRPGKKVEVVEEDDISFDETSPLADELHPERAEEQE